MDRYLLLLSSKESQFFYLIRNNEYLSIYNMYKSMNIIERIIRKILVLFGINISCYYGNWKYDTSSYTKIILEDATIDDGIFKRLRNQFHGAEIIFWFRNSLNAVDYENSKKMHLKHVKLCDRVISFDKKDSLLYGYQYLENAYVRDYDLSPGDIKYDMIFLGSDKSRYESIIKVVNYTNSLGWNNYIYILSKKHTGNTYVHNSFMNYKDYLRIMNQSKVILDLVDVSYQNGYSLRVFESLFYKKKLITNMDIIKEESFYHPNNIYVIDLDDMSSYDGLQEFMNLPYVPISETILQRYNFNNWIKRI